MASDAPKSSPKDSSTTADRKVQSKGSEKLETSNRVAVAKKTPSSERKPAASARPKAKAKAKVGGAATADPVRVYLRDMGQVSLLDREGEVEIAKRIESGIHDQEFGVLGNANGMAEVLSLGDRFRGGELELDAVLDGLAIEGSDSPKVRERKFLAAQDAQQHLINRAREGTLRGNPYIQ